MTGFLIETKDDNNYMLLKVYDLKGAIQISISDITQADTVYGEQGIIIDNKPEVLELIEYLKKCVE